jgi:hypothetical protein
MVVEEQLSWKTSILLLSGVWPHRASAIFTGRIPISDGLLLESVSLFLQDSETKKYRQETLLSKVESEPSVTLTVMNDHAYPTQGVPGTGALERFVRLGLELATCLPRLELS